MKPRTKPSFDVFVENLPGNVYRRVRRPDGGYHFEFLSAGLFRQFGIDNERLLAEESVKFDWVHPDDRARMISDLEISAATLGMLDHRVRVISQDGRVFWARGIGQPSRRADGSIVWDGIVIDVTREVEAESALHVARSEAERARSQATRLVSEATAKLRTPIAAMGERIEAAFSSPLDTGLLRDLQRYHSRLVAAVNELMPLDGATDAGRAFDMPKALLTQRQLEVYGMLGRGLSNKEIAQALGITPGTVKLHVAAVLRGLGLSSRRNAIKQ
jgi:two-component system sensor histidine kinase/response regulator